LSNTFSNPLRRSICSQEVAKIDEKPRSKSSTVLPWGELSPDLTIVDVEVKEEAV
jgi:hypothetical protein